MSLDLGLVRSDAELAAAIWRNMLGARGARGIDYPTAVGAPHRFRRTVNLAGGEVDKVDKLEAAALEAEEARDDGSGLHDHAMLYSPAVAVIKDDQGHRIAPYEINVLSCVPVHAGTVRAKFSIDDNEFRSGVSGVMRERMARALRLFEERGDRVLILGAFGVGQSCNSPEMIGELWADLLCAQGARFEGVFDKVVFALSNKHRETFEKAFNATVLEAELEQGLTESD